MSLALIKWSFLFLKFRRRGLNTNFFHFQKCNSHRRRKSIGNETEVISPASLHSFLSRKTYFRLNITISEYFAKQETNFTQVITRPDDNLVQRRDNNLISGFCCENEDLCNAKGCGQTGRRNNPPTIYNTQVSLIFPVESVSYLKETTKFNV